MSELYPEEDQIFDVPEEVKTKPEKKKRALTQKQLDALARGRQKMEEKRKLQKSKEVKKEDNKGAKEHVEQKKEQLKTKRKIAKEQDILEKVRARESAKKKEQARKEAVEKWEAKRAEVLDKCETEEMFLKLQDILDEIHESTYLFPEKLDEWIKNKLKDLGL